MEVTFKFKPRQKVVTALGDVGFVTMCAIDDTDTLQVSVKMSATHQWFREDELTLHVD